MSGTSASTFRRTSSLFAWRLALAAMAMLLMASACDDEPKVRVVPIAPTAELAPNRPAGPTPVPTAGRPPARPADLLAGANLLVTYLPGADRERCLPELVSAWALADVEGERCLLADLDGDGAEEFAFVLVLPDDSDGPAPPGEVWFYDGNDHRLLGSARSLANAVLHGLRIEAVDDLSGDGLPEIVLSVRDCGASTCVSDVLVVSAHRGRLEDLAPAGLSVPGLDAVSVEDADGDGRLDLVLVGGQVASVGAGPQRTSRLTLSWGGISFFVDERPDPPRYLIHAIADADERFAAGDYAAARTLYEQAAADRTLEDWKEESGQPPGGDELSAYALFRAGLAALRLGDEPAARALFASAFERHPTALHTLASATYVGALDRGSTPTEACRLVETVLGTRRSEFNAIWDYGYANAEHSIAGLCR